MNKFKIIIPVYNSEKWIEKCLKILNDQTYKNWNAVIINDASHDETLIKIKNFLHQFLSKINLDIEFLIEKIM
jgi:glycosyltransferase involved in cell wall biosynthesis